MTRLPIPMSSSCAKRCADAERAAERLKRIDEMARLLFVNSHYALDVLGTCADAERAYVNAELFEKARDAYLGRKS